MVKRERYQNRIELLQGTLDLLILQTLQWGARHGYGISQALRAQSAELLQVDTGSLYPALHRLEARGWIAATWDLSEKGKRARYYRLTAAGRKHLVGEETKWDRFCRAMGLVLKAAAREVQ